MESVGKTFERFFSVIYPAGFRRYAKQGCVILSQQYKSTNQQ